MVRNLGQSDAILSSRKWHNTTLVTLVRVKRHHQRPNKDYRREITQLAKKRFLIVSIITLTKKKSLLPVNYYILAKQKKEKTLIGINNVDLINIA